MNRPQARALQRRTRPIACGGTPLRPSHTLGCVVQRIHDLVQSGERRAAIELLRILIAGPRP